MSFYTTTNNRLAIIGAGTMGRAIAAGIIRNNLVKPHDVFIANRTPRDAQTLACELGAHNAADNDEACRHADVIILCVKPKDISPVLAEFAQHDTLSHKPLLISIAAGVTIATIERLVSVDLPVIRAMPNTPCSIGHGMTVVARGKHACHEHLEIAFGIFGSIGRCIALDESLLDVVTAVSASGPAFIYLVIEALADGGVMCGLPRNVALELVSQMTLGAAAMALTSEKHPAALRDDVTTPKGCTIAGLLALEDGAVRSSLARAVQTATRVAAELGK